MKYAYRSFFIIFSTYCNFLSQPHVSYINHIYFAVFCRWGELVVPMQWWSPRNTENQQSRNTKPWWELNQDTLNGTVLRAHRWKIVNICFVPVLLLLVTLFHFLLWFVVIGVCFPSRTNFPLKVSRRTCRYCLNCYLHYHHIIYSVRIHRHARFVGVSLFSGVTFTASHYMFMSIHLHGTLGPPKEISHWNVPLL